jgi:hypothetical protein
MEYQMKLRRKISLVIAVALAGATVGIVAGAAPAMAAGKPGQLEVVGNCGDLLDMRVRIVGAPINLTVTVPSNDPSEVWNLTATQQEYNALTGGRLGSPVNLVPNPLPQMAFNAAEGGFTTTADIDNTDNLTHGFSYVATRTSPTPLTCQAQGFWTNPAGTGEGPAPQNPTARPDTAPAFANESEADVGTNDALILMDQEMLATGLGIPPANRFTVRVNGVARTSTAVQIFNDDPPNQAILDVTFSGLPIASTDTVTLQYAKPLGNAGAQLQDLEALKTPSFGPLSISVV